MLSVHALSGSLGLSMLDIASLRSSYLGDLDRPFFILGNGSTVNSLTEKQFCLMARGVSVGVNAWPVHPFVPTMYSFEYHKYSFSPDAELTFLLRKAEERMEKSQETVNAPILLFRPGLPAGVSAVGEVTPIMKANALIYGRANLFSETESALSADLELLLGGDHRSQYRQAVLPDNGSSVVRLVFLALEAGFKEIVLIGVDLNGSDYFWYDPQFIEKYKDYRHILVREPGDSTLTRETSERPFDTSQFLFQLSLAAEKTLGARIFACDKRSVLAEKLPLYDWKF